MTRRLTTRLTTITAVACLSGVLAACGDTDTPAQAPSADQETSGQGGFEYVDVSSPDARASAAAGDVVIHTDGTAVWAIGPDGQEAWRHATIEACDEPVFVYPVSDQYAGVRCGAGGAFVTSLVDDEGSLSGAVEQTDPQHVAVTNDGTIVACSDGVLIAYEGFEASEELWRAEGADCSVPPTVEGPLIGHVFDRRGSLEPVDARTGQIRHELLDVVDSERTEWRAITDDVLVVTDVDASGYVGGSQLVTTGGDPVGDYLDGMGIAAARDGIAIFHDTVSDEIVRVDAHGDEMWRVPAAETIACVRSVNETYFWGASECGNRKNSGFADVATGELVHAEADAIGVGPLGGNMVLATPDSVLFVRDGEVAETVEAEGIELLASGNHLVVAKRASMETVIIGMIRP